MSSGTTEASEESPTEISDQDSTYQDSAIGGDHNSEADPLSPSATKVCREYGRTYHSYSEYILPNDDHEQDRIDLEHHVFNLSLDSLFSAPISHSPQKVLDVGTGTGIWAIEFADKHPTANVTGTDISPIQPEWVPPNLQFEVHDANDTWTFSGKFDFIHCRQPYNGIEIQRLLRQSLDGLNPGGWFEITEIALPVLSDDGSIEGTYLLEWCEHMSNAGKKLNFDFHNQSSFKKWMKEAGFVEVEERIHKLPIGTWPKDQELKVIGRYEMANLFDGLEAFSLRLFRRYLEWSEEELALFLALVRNDLHNLEIHPYFKVYNVFGRKSTQ